MATRSFRLNQQPPVRRSIWGIRLSISGNHYYCGLYTTILYALYPTAHGNTPFFTFHYNHTFFHVVYIAESVGIRSLRAP